MAPPGVPWGLQSWAGVAVTIFVKARIAPHRERMPLGRLDSRARRLRPRIRSRSHERRRQHRGRSHRARLHPGRRARLPANRQGDVANVIAARRDAARQMLEVLSPAHEPAAPAPNQDREKPVQFFKLANLRFRKETTVQRRAKGLQFIHATPPSACQLFGRADAGAAPISFPVEK